MPMRFLSNSDGRLQRSAPLLKELLILAAPPARRPQLFVGCKKLSVVEQADAVMY